MRMVSPEEAALTAAWMEVYAAVGQATMLTSTRRVLAAEARAKNAIAMRHTRVARSVARNFIMISPIRDTQPEQAQKHARRRMKTIYCKEKPQDLVLGLLSENRTGCGLTAGGFRVRSLSNSYSNFSKARCRCHSAIPRLLQSKIDE